MHPPVLVGAPVVLPTIDRVSARLTLLAVVPNLVRHRPHPSQQLPLPWDY